MYRINKLLYNSYSGLKGSELLYKKFLEYEIKNAHIYSGGAIMDLVDQFHNSKNNNISTYIHAHEQGLGHASTGYAKASGKMGLSIVTSGPGLTNILTPMLDATNDSTPMMVISGQVSTNVMGTNAFQECDAVNLSTPTTKFSYCVKDIEELPFIFDIAYLIANNGKKGCVHIDLPKNISNAVFSNKIFEDKKNYLLEKKYNHLFQNYKMNNTNITISDNIKIKSVYNKKYIKKIANLINNSKKPIFYIGQGCNNYSEGLTDLVKKSNIPVTTTIHAMNSFDENNELSLQMLGMHGNAAANYAIQDADLIICIGARFDDRTTGNLEKYAPNAKKASINKSGGIVHNNINIDEINTIVNADFPILGDSGIFIKKLYKYIQFKPRDKWINNIKNWKKKYEFKYNELDDGRIKTQSVISDINELMNTDAIITTGVGSHQMMAAQFIKWNNKNKILTSGSLGVMGAGVPYAIGAQIAYPKRQVIVIDGDSSFMMTMNELKTIKEYNLPIKIAIMNNHTQGMVKEWENLFFDSRITATTNNNNPNFKELAECFGIKGFYCNNKEKLYETVNDFLNFDGPSLCEFDVVDEICLPLVKPGCALDDMLLEEEYVNKFKKNNINKNSVPPS